MKKILMLLESDFPPDIRVENEIESLISNGHEVHILCYNNKKQQKLNEDINGLKVHRFNIPKFIYKASAGCLKSNIYFNHWKKQLNNLLKQVSGFDFIHIHDLQLARVGYWFKQEHGAKLVLDLHENWPSLLDLSSHTKTFLGKILFSRYQWESYEKKYANLADKIIVVVDEAKERLIKLGVNKKDIIVLTNALNLKYFDFKTPKPEKEKTIFVYGGGINYHRGLQNVIASSALVKTKSPFEIWIIGDGSYLNTLKSFAIDKSVSHNVKFWGWQKQKELLRLVSKAHVALIPHLKSDHTNSTIPHKLFQYMYAGIPILTSDCEPLARIVKETQSGLIYDSQNINDLANKMEQMINDTELREKYGNSKNWVDNKYNWTMSAISFLNYYNS